MRERRLAHRPARGLAVFDSYLFVNNEMQQALDTARSLTPAQLRANYDNNPEFIAQLLRDRNRRSRKTQFGYISPLSVNDKNFTGRLSVTDEAFRRGLFSRVTASEEHPTGINCYSDSSMLVLGTRVASDCFSVTTCMETTELVANPGLAHVAFKDAFESAYEDRVLGVTRMQALIEQIRAT